MNRLSTYFDKTFLGRVLKEDRLVAYFFMAFVAFQSLAQLFTAEVTPFFLYGMYSEVLEPKPTYVRAVCFVDGVELEQSEMPRYAGELFFSTLDRYQRLEANGGEDLFGTFLADRFSWLPIETREEIDYRLSFHPEDEEAFEQWIHRYLERSLGHQIHSIRVYRETFRYVDMSPELVEREDLIVLTR